MLTRRAVFPLLAGAVVEGQTKQHPNFSGRWVMNEKASDLGADMRAGYYREWLVIDHHEPHIRIDYTVEYDGERTHANYDLTTDGVQIYTETAKGVDVSMSAWKGDQLVTDCTIEGSGRADRVTRYISENGKQLFAAYGKSTKPRWLVFDKVG